MGFRLDRIAQRLWPSLIAWMLAAPQAGAIELQALETKDLKLLYFDPQQTYLVPHVARSFQNSLAFQQKMYHWQPYDGQRRSVHAWMVDRFVSRVYCDWVGRGTTTVPAGRFATTEMVMYPDLNDWVPLPAMLTTLAKPFLPKYRMWFEAAPPYRLVRRSSTSGEEAVLLGSTRLPYWKLNAPGGEKHLRELGLSPARVLQ